MHWPGLVWYFYCCRWFSWGYSWKLHSKQVTLPNLRSMWEVLLRGHEYWDVFFTGNYKVTIYHNLPDPICLSLDWFWIWEEEGYHLLESWHTLILSIFSLIGAIFLLNGLYFFFLAIFCCNSTNYLYFIYHVPTISAPNFNTSYIFQHLAGSLWL